MADIIDKIGKYFAEQEARLRQVYVQAAAQTPQIAAQKPVTCRTPLSVSSPGHSHPRQPAQVDRLHGRNTPRERQPPSLLRRRLSLQSDASRNNVEAGDRKGSEEVPKPAMVPPLAFGSSLPNRAHPNAWVTEDAWGERDGEELASWRSTRSSYDSEPPKVNDVPSRPEVASSDDDDESGGRLSRSSSSSRLSSEGRKPRLLRKGSIKKKRRSSTKSATSEPAPEQIRRDREEKVAAALALAQERARRIQMEREQHVRDQELAREEAQLKIQDQMDKIEAIRRKSKQFALRLRPSSAPTTPGAASGSSMSSRSSSSPFSSEMVHNESRQVDKHVSTDATSCAAETFSSNNAADCGSFLDNLERQLRDRMVIDMRVREKSLSNQLEQDQEWRKLRSQIDTQNAHNAKKQQRIASLEATKQALEKELQHVQDELSASRSQRVELEAASRKERNQRHKSAERQLKARLRLEEWNRMMDDEKVRSDVAAEARARASQRVVARGSSLKKMLHAFDQERRRRSTSNNNASNTQNDDLASPRRQSTPSESGGAKATLLLPPELAEFEEEGLCFDTEMKEVTLSPEVKTPHTSLHRTDPNVKQEREDGEGLPTALLPAVPSETDQTLDVATKTPALSMWRVPLFTDQALFERLLRHEMLLSSDDEEEDA